MEKRISKKCEDHVLQFKGEIKKWLDENNITLSGDQTLSQFLEFIYDYNTVTLSKDDFIKRKRVKNEVPYYERCCACRANGEQCSRRKQDNENYCGTHIKGTPHGSINTIKENTNNSLKKVEVSLKEIQGIWHYVDDNKNIYKTEDVLSNRLNPSIIGSYRELGNGTCEIYN